MYIYIYIYSVRCCSGRTEFQTASMSCARRSVNFERKKSQRYSRRPNFDSVRDIVTSSQVNAVAHKNKSVLSTDLYIKFILIIIRQTQPNYSPEINVSASVRGLRQKKLVLSSSVTGRCRVRKVLVGVTE